MTSYAKFDDWLIVFERMLAISEWFKLESIPCEDVEPSVNVVLKVDKSYSNKIGNYTLTLTTSGSTDWEGSKVKCPNPKSEPNIFLKPLPLTLTTSGSTDWESSKVKCLNPKSEPNIF